MNLRQEIDTYAAPEDKTCLHWLLDIYHWQSKWNFVAKCTRVRYGKLSYQTNHVWSPTREGRILYEHMSKE